MLSLALLSFLASASLSLAASSSPVIPTGISAGCSTFLTTLDSNTQLQTCLKAINTATAAFSPSTNTTTPSASSITSALTTLCSATTTSACPSSFFRGQLSDFYTACSAEIGGSNADSTVQMIYDTLYTATPIRDAVCSTDTTSGGFCVNTLLAPGVTSSLTALIQTAKNYLSATLAIAGYKRATTTTSSFISYPNATSWTTTGLPFLFLTPSSPSSSLCSACAQKIMTAYVNFENAEPYASGIASSPLLGKQKDLWSAMTSTSGCGSAFGTSVVVNAGASPTGAVVQGSLSGAKEMKSGFVGIIGVLVAALVAF